MPNPSDELRKAASATNEAARLKQVELDQKHDEVRSLKQEVDLSARHLRDTLQEIHGLKKQIDDIEQEIKRKELESVAVVAAENNQKQAIRDGESAIRKLEKEIVKFQNEARKLEDQANTTAV